MHFEFSSRRRKLLRSGMAAAAASWLASPALAQLSSATDSTPIRLRFFAPSGYLSDPARIETGIQRLRTAGFTLDNTQALYRRHQRFAGTDAERIADLQDVATGRAPTPKILLGARGGYGAMRLLPHVDWPSLGSRMREAGTLLLGYSDICAVQLALQAQGRTGSFAGPLLYSEFGSPNPSLFTLQEFIRTVSSSQLRVEVAAPMERHIRLQGTWWGGNLSVLSSLAGSPWLPNVPGGILFLEDVGEQPYRIERMLQTLYLAGVFRQQQAIVFGTFRLSNERDLYDENYDLDTVIHTLRRLTGLPVLTGFPSGHIRDKVTMPLGYPAELQSGAQGYSVRFSGYPGLTASTLNLASLLEAAGDMRTAPASDAPTFDETSN
ncbi:LD-carboxypeptidase [Brachymonas denitrificans]|uniref:LD-carboxypeptidase n=1 Tax=Brachymonas denitrificans TaxID=28220 RepID=UPI002AFECD22|nr:LD-carboxypeptidase [Brachymonas denitrificans]